LIQSTKVAPDTSNTDIAAQIALWRDREAKHDKKRGVYAFQALTVKCFLDVAAPDLIIDDYITANAPAQSQPKSQLQSPAKAQSKIASQSQPQRSVATESKPSVASAAVAEPVLQRQESVDREKKECVDEPLSAMSAEVLQWKRKALEYDDLFQFTRKTLAQRDELSQRWKAEEQRTRAMEKRIHELKAQKREALKEWNSLRNANANTQTQNENEQTEEKVKVDEDEEKREVLEDGDDEDGVSLSSVRWMEERRAMMAEMDALEKKTKEGLVDAKDTLQITPVHLLIALLIMIVAYAAGAWNGSGNCAAEIADNAKIEM